MTRHSSSQPRALGRLARTPLGLFSLITLGVVLTSALISLAWTPYDPAAADIQIAWQSPSWQHWLGTDGSGRDTLSRLMVGSQVTVLVALGAGVFSGALGLVIALAGALGRNWLREPLAVLIDVLIAFPTLLIAMMFASILGGSVAVVILAVSIGFGVSIGRVLRAEIRQVASADYVLAARASGVSRARIVRRHILPNVSSVFIVQLTLVMGLAVLAEAGLSYLGFGAPPSVPSWGRMLAETQTFIGVHPGSVIWPGLAITLTVLAFSLLGDALRDTLDPTLGRERRMSKRTNTGVFNR
jgi:peptide/nickel transport system permease protein